MKSDTLLQGLRIVECAAFIAAPFASLSLAKLGAEVIRIDPIGGGIDQHRWPQAADGTSLYWASLNRGKRSVCLDLSRPEGRELARAIVTAPGEGGGIFLSNLAARPWLSHESLSALRADLISLRITGNSDGSTALDYTVNSAVGFPMVTGSAPEGEPVNHVLPAWDLVTGMTVATALLAAERHRRLTGEGQHLDVALSDVALAVCGDLGYLAEVQVNGVERERAGNHLYGAFGHDFATRDGRRLMIVALSPNQWQSVCKATGLDTAALSAQIGASLDDESVRHEARETLRAALAPWFLQRTLDEAGRALDEAGACWGPYQTFRQLVDHDPRCSLANPLFESVPHPAVGPMLTARSPIRPPAALAAPALPSTTLGQHTEQVLAETLRLPAHAIGDLYDRRIAWGPKAG